MAEELQWSKGSVHIQPRKIPYHYGSCQRIVKREGRGKSATIKPSTHAAIGSHLVIAKYDGSSKYLIELTGKSNKFKNIPKVI